MVAQVLIGIFFEIWMGVLFLRGWIIKWSDRLRNFILLQKEKIKIDELLAELHTVKMLNQSLIMELAKIQNRKLIGAGKLSRIQKRVSMDDFYQIILEEVDQNKIKEEIKMWKEAKEAAKNKDIHYLLMAVISVMPILTRVEKTALDPNCAGCLNQYVRRIQRLRSVLNDWGKK